MKTMQKVALAVALTAMAGGAMAAPTYLAGNNNSKTVPYFEAVVQGSTCHVKDIFGDVLLLGKGGPAVSNHLAWWKIAALCTGKGSICTAAINSYTGFSGNNCVGEQSMATATLYMDDTSGYKAGTVIITPSAGFTVVQDPADNSPTITLN